MPLPLHLRPSATIVPSSLPPQFEFLQKPLVPQRKYRINFRHPAYTSDDNILFTLYAWDHEDGGIHHGLAHNACAIIADNRFDGYLSRTCNPEHEDGKHIEEDWDDVLPASDADYYFYVPYLADSASASTTAPLPPAPSPSPSRPPYRWPVVPTFQDWRFPRVLPAVWSRCAETQPTSNTTAPQSTLGPAIRQRDITCRVTAFHSGTEAAHLIPEHENQWFNSNSMAEYNSDLSLDPSNLLRDLGNAVLLRSDIHTAFDNRKFVFFPKDRESLVLHMLEPTRDIGVLYHNTRLSMPFCSLEFLFARFAWSIFPSLSGFLSRPARSRLVVRSDPRTGQRLQEEVSNSILLGRKAAASRSNSPTKRTKSTADLDEDAEFISKRQRTDELRMSARSSFRSPLPTPENDSNEHGEQPPTPEDDCEVVYTERERSPSESTCRNPYLDQLKRNALIQQRPVGYDPRMPPYDKHRPARDELELMGVEILEDSGDDDF